MPDAIRVIDSIDELAASGWQDGEGVVWDSNQFARLDVVSAPLSGALDEWAAFDANGGGASWEALTYGDWISGIDSLLSAEITAGSASKADLGAASDGASHVYSYTAGDGAVEVLLIAGSHGSETLGQYAAMRWFQQFVQSSSASYRQMRRWLRVTWVPTLNPAGYRAGRKNANDVDINRNSDLLWELYPDTDSSSPTYKGAEAADQPETQMIATLLADGDYRVVIDCHNYGASGDSVAAAVPGTAFLGPRELGAAALDTWQSLYGGGISTSWLMQHTTQPTLIEYGNYVMRHTNGRTWTGAILLEASADLFDSSADSITQQAMRAYAGLIHTYLLAFLARAGQATAIPYTYSYHGYQSSNFTMPDASEHPLSLQWSLGGGYDLQETVNIPLPYAPALVTVHLTGQLVTVGGAGRAAVGVRINGTAPTASWAKSVTFGASAGDATPFAVEASTRVATVSNTALLPVSLYYDFITGSLPSVQRSFCTITVTPDTLERAAPRIGAGH